MHILARLALPFLLASTGALAQGAYPTKPVRLVIPLAAASAVDNAARLVAQRMADSLGQPFVVDQSCDWQASLRLHVFFRQ